MIALRSATIALMLVTAVGALGGGVTACGDDDEESASSTGGTGGTGGTEGGAATGGTGGAVSQTCGNGVVEGTEACDDGSQSAACNFDCSVSACGDGIPNATAGELCDDGGTAAGDGCAPDCTLEIPDGCGNNFVEGNEQCDDAGESTTCNLDCTKAECGDGKLNPSAGEQCDDKNLVSGDGCAPDCKFAKVEHCGNGVCDPGETCSQDSCQADCGACTAGTPCTANADCAAGLACNPATQGFECGPVLTDYTLTPYLPVPYFKCATFIGPKNGQETWTDNGNGSYTLTTPAVIKTPLGEVPLTTTGGITLTQNAKSISAEFFIKDLPTGGFGTSTFLDASLKAKLGIITGPEAITALGGEGLVPKEASYFEFTFGGAVDNITFLGPPIPGQTQHKSETGPVADLTLIRYLYDPCDPLFVFQVPTPFKDAVSESMASFGGSQHGALTIQSTLPLWDGTTSKVRPVSGNFYIQGTLTIPKIKILKAPVARIEDFDPKGDGMAHPLIVNNAISSSQASMIGIPDNEVDVARMAVGKIVLALPVPNKVIDAFGSLINIDLTPEGPLAAASLYSYTDAKGSESMFRGRTSSSLLPGSDLAGWTQKPSYDVQGYSRSDTDWGYRFTTTYNLFKGGPVVGPTFQADMLMRVDGNDVTLSATGNIDLGSIEIEGVAFQLGKVHMTLYYDWTKKMLCGETDAVVQGAPCVVRLCAAKTGWITQATCQAECGDGTCNGVESCHYKAPACQKDCGKCPGGTPCTLGEDCASGLCPTGLCVQCVTNSHCTGKNWCSVAGICEAPKAIGLPCVNGFECASGNCPAGICSPCNSNGDCTSPDWCDAVGICESPKADGLPCVNGFECASGKCPNLICVGCAKQSDCTGGKWCSVAGTCEPQKANGAVCAPTAGYECLSGNCPAGLCVECDEQSDCSGTEWCAIDGKCYAKKPNGSVCAPTANYECTSGHCPAGLCVECAAQADCGSTKWCALDGKCYAKKAYGSVCTPTAGYECTSGKCPAGLCVNCVTTSDCSSGNWCAADGKCYAKKSYGAVCTSGSECASGKCPAGICVNCVKQSDCSSSKWCAVDGKCYSKKSNGSACLTSAECTNKCCVGFCGSWC